MCAKNHVNIFSSFLDIRQNVEWPRFLAHPVTWYTVVRMPCVLKFTFYVFHLCFANDFINENKDEHKINIFVHQHSC